MNFCSCGIIRCKAGHFPDLKPFLFDWVSESREQKGCLKFDIYQSLDDEDLFFLTEEWVDEYWSQRHRSQSFALYFESVCHLILESPINYNRIVKLG